MPDPSVVANTSPLLYLHQIDCLHILETLYRAVIVPPAVLEELRAGQQQGLDVPDLARLAWIQVRPKLVPDTFYALSSGFRGGTSSLSAEGPTGSLFLRMPPPAAAASLLRQLRVYPKPRSAPPKRSDRSRRVRDRSRRV
jgi:hypothetical protein